MPLITGWFNEDLNLDWDRYEYSFLHEQEGSAYWTHPLWWLLPQVLITEEDLKGAPQPIWISEIDPSCSYGKVMNEAEGKYIVDLPNNFGDYIQQRDYKHRKTFRNIMRRNEDIQISLGSQADIDALWDVYCSKLQSLNDRQDCMPYEAKELHFRRELYRGPNIEILRVSHNDQVIGCNVSSWRQGTVYDLAFLGSLDGQYQNRSLGRYLILKNIERAIEKGIATYDLLTKNYGYKHTFGAYEVKCKHYIVCSREFAQEYKIDPEMVSEFI